MHSPNPTKIRDLLLKSEAQTRGALIGDIDYEISLSLSRDLDTYTGRVKANFDLTGDASAGTFIDWRGQSIQKLELNGSGFELEQPTPYRIALPGNLLKSGANELIIEYTNPYDTSGEGFHRFTDPADGEVYLHSDFEPFDAHRLFPCFDQPDLKATYLLDVEAPADWKVISNYEITDRKETEGRQTLKFAKTLKFSTYLFNVCAGPFAEYTDEYKRADGFTIPLALYCRKSMAQYMEAEEIFTITKQGFDFYQEFFSYDYPFGKYDQLFVPEFNAGAMENVGSVTFAEVFLFRQQVTENQRLDRADVILHEMAHMWFGDLVTMDWWDGLWLNESFATFMAAWATADATRFGEEAWLEFNARMKRWAYYQDELPTTHPIHCDVADTESAFANFDGISYGKGASVLKQLAFRIGADNFKKGMAAYFKEFAYGNTTLEDFMGALEKAAGTDLSGWTKDWLLTPQLNTLLTKLDPDGGVRINQESHPDYPCLREHKVNVQTFKSGSGGWQKAGQEDLLIKGEVTQATAPDSDFEFLFANGGDYAFAKVYLDPASLKFALENIDTCPDPLLSQVLWSTFIQMMRDCRLKPSAFLDLVVNKLAPKPGRADNLTTLAAVVRTSPVVVSRYLPAAARDEWRRKVLDAAWQNIAATTGDTKLNWTRLYISNLAGEDYFSRLISIFWDEKNETVTLDDQMRWDILARMASFGVAGTEEMVSKMKERDGSDRGKREALRVAASFGDAANKKKFWDIFTSGGIDASGDKLSLDLVRTAMAGFRWEHQQAVLAEYDDLFYPAAEKVFNEQAGQYSQSFNRLLFPRHSHDKIAAGETFLAGNQTADVLRRQIIESLDELKRELKIQQYENG